MRLETLERAAAAMNCELVYAFVPRTTLEGSVRTQARRKAARHLARLPTMADSKLRK